MQVQPFSAEERETLLRRREQAARRYNDLMDLGQYEEAKIPESKAERLEEGYFKRLPRLTVSCCPFDGKPLVRTFDPFGLDGLWWRPDATPRELPTCPHFCVVRGAVHYNGLPPRAGSFEVHPGPEVPHVIPRLLAYPGMVAVISQIDMKNGYTAYPIAYFAERRPPPQDLTADWPRTIYTYTTQLGVPGWQPVNDPWDFDLLPWLDAGKVRWCPPGSDNTFLSTAPGAPCPYVDMPGTRKRILVEGDESWTQGLPSGASISPID